MASRGQVREAAARAEKKRREADRLAGEPLRAYFRWCEAIARAAYIQMKNHRTAYKIFKALERGDR
jgi:hypothetical protein